MEKSFAVGCSEFFGRQPETQTLREFAEELRKLSPADKLEIHAGLVANGVECSAPLTPTA